MKDLDTEKIGTLVSSIKEANIISQEFSSELEKIARFRNRLGHLYW